MSSTGDLHLEPHPRRSSRFRDSRPVDTSLRFLFIPATAEGTNKKGTPIPMSRYVGEAQDQLRQLARELRAVHYRLLGIVASLPAPPPEQALRAEMEAGG